MRSAVAPAVYLSVFAAFATVSGCKASVDAKVDAGKEGDVADFDKPMDSRSLAEQPRTFDEQAAQTALLGARQDLSYGGSTAPRCKCLAVSVGQPTDSAFRWATKRPSIDRNTQVVVAISSTGITCESGPEATGASYWGYEVVGQDVVVVVESAKPGRPVAQGAIIPRPAGNGQVYVRPLNKSVPYGRPASGSGERCQVANLGPVASAPSSSSSSSTPSGTTRIHSEEREPSSTRVDIPE